MIKETILLTGTALMLFELPAWKRITAPKHREVSLRVTTGKDEFDQADHYFKPDGRTIKTRELPFAVPEGISIHDWVWREKNRKYEFYRVNQVNLFNRKPFTCLYCMTFWIGLIFAALSFILSFGDWLSFAAAAVVAPSLAKAFDRWFNSLPVKI